MPYFQSPERERERERDRENLVQHRRGKTTQQAIRKYNQPYFRELIWTLEDRARQMMMALDDLHKLTQASHRFTCRGRPHVPSCLPRHHSRQPGRPSSHCRSLGLSGSGRHDKICSIPPLSTHWHRSSFPCCGWHPFQWVFEPLPRDQAPPLQVPGSHQKDETGGVLDLLLEPESHKPHIWGVHFFHQEEKGAGTLR